MRIVTTYNNFARGKIDHDMMGRYDLPIYTSGWDVLENLFTNFKGNAIYRTGFEDMLGVPFQDCVFQEFKFSNNQNYLLVFYNTKIRFLSYDVNGNFGWVLSSGSPLEVTTPYTLDQSRELQFAQNADVMIITHNAFPVKQLKRIAANNFTLTDYTYTGGTAPFGAGQYPACCLYYKARLYFAATQAKITTLWASETGQYNNFVIGGTVTDTSPLQFTIADITQTIENLFGGDNSLIVTSADGIVAVNGGGVGTAITASSIEANLTSADGANGTVPFKKDGLVFYIGRNNRNMYYFSYDLLTESFIAEDANFISYDITQGGIGKIRWKKDRNDLIYGIRNDGVLLTLNFKQKENIIGWHTQRSQGVFKDQAVITDNEGNPQLFALVVRNGSYYIERMADHVQFAERTQFFTYNPAIETAEEAEKRDTEAYNRVIAEQLCDCIYLDNASTIENLQQNSITYNPANGRITATSGVFVAGDVGKHISYKTMTGYESGRFEITGYVSATVVDVTVLQEPTTNTYPEWYLSFRTISGLSQYNGHTVGIVTDGGYLSEFLISGGTQDLGQQTLTAVIGYGYTAIAKSFCLGFQAGAENTQTTMKAISQVGIRCVSSAGGKIGSSLYALEPVQELSQNDINYLPPIPIDGTKYVTYVDDNTKDKFFYFVQDEPLPFTITSVMIDANHAVTR
jgi:hypothetical protein